jgi:hypothetical protein
MPCELEMEPLGGAGWAGYWVAWNWGMTTPGEFGGIWVDGLYECSHINCCGPD